jgi:hypothetical protein
MSNLYALDGVCHNAEPGTYGHECGKSAVWIGTLRRSVLADGSGAFKSGFCDDCKQNGFEAQAVLEWEPRTGPARYRPTLRPAGFATLPAGVRWTYVEAPEMEGLANRPDLPRSRWRYGVIEVDRPLTAEETKRFDLEAVAIPAAACVGAR